MKTIKDNGNVYIYRTSEKDLMYWKIFVIIIIILTIITSIYTANESYFNFFLITFIIFIVISILIYFNKKKESKNPFLMMKDKILYIEWLHLKINFCDIISIQVLGTDVYIIYLDNGKKRTEILYIGKDYNLSKLVALRIQEYTDNYKINHIEYKIK